jgi:hypothetical protein
MAEHVRKNLDIPKFIKLLEAGWTDKQLANFYDVHITTVQLWRQKDPEFKTLVEKHRRPSNRQVERTLYERATGYTIRELKRHTDRLGNIETTETIKEIPPDTTAMIFWLKNRDRKRWQDRVNLDGDGLKITVTRKQFKKKVEKTKPVSKKPKK